MILEFVLGRASGGMAYQCGVLEMSSKIQKYKGINMEMSDGSKVSFDISEVNMSCEILSSAVTDHIFSFFFSEPLMLLAF